MIMHILKYNNVHFDYLVGSRIRGFNNMVGLDDMATIAVFEGDEYLASALDQRPKFHVYQPHIALISGIAWDHVNVFPTFEKYKEQFEVFIKHLPYDGFLAFCDEDDELKNMVEQSDTKAERRAYSAHPYTVVDEKTYLQVNHQKLALEIFGHHNLQNISGAKLICEKLGITNEQFYNAIVHFQGAGKRLQELAGNHNTAVYLDFAHSPSKVKATIDAVREQYPNRKLVACLELYTYSSLTRSFLEHYRMTMNNADQAIVCINPETILHKRLTMINPEEVRGAFGTDRLVIFDNSSALTGYLFSMYWENSVLLLMSSGNFWGLNLQELAEKIIT
jgi:UDP-N-acetylmuramate: L-alanyl-gamma-D-glutamyl-meso-diaminopimelate ligase